MDENNLNRLLDEFSKSHLQNTCNPFAAWGMSENDHTKLLVAFLRYNNVVGEYPILKSFLSCFTNLELRELNDVKVKFNQRCDRNGYIDGYVTFISQGFKYALIIENKVYDAPDQKKQVQRYIEHALKDIRENPIDDALQRIWVFYITRDGSKTINEVSYSLENQEASTNIGDRFVGINYREHVIEWLNLVVNSQYAEALVNVVKSYLEYLVYELCNEQNLSIKEKLLLKTMCIPEDIRFIKKDQVKGLYDLRRKIQDIRRKGNDEINNEALNNVSSALSEVLLKLEKHAFDQFEKQTKAILDDWTKDKDLKWVVARRGLRDDGKGYLQIRLVKDWGTVHMEWIPIGVADMLCFNKQSTPESYKYYLELHIEGSTNELKQTIVNELKRVLPPVGFLGKRSRIYKLEVVTDQPFAQMSEQKLRATLHKCYTENAAYMFNLLVDYRDKYKKYQH